MLRGAQKGAFRGEHEIKREKKISSINAFYFLRIDNLSIDGASFQLQKDEEEKSQNEENEKLMIIDGVVLCRKLPS